MDKRKVFVITGATGLLGRNLMLEIIKQNYMSLSSIELIILGRNNNNSLKQRIVDILVNTDFSYIKSCVNIELLNDFIENNMNFVDFDITTEDILEPCQKQYLKSMHIDYFFHIAALTDFRNSDIVKTNLYKVNVEGTKKILSLIQGLSLNEFCYVSSAYACGNTAGNIKPNYINFEVGFRNNYECSKLLAETYVRDVCNNSNIRYRIFRPSTISGRLLENDLGRINKFDVFYSWAAFFLKMKMKTQNYPIEALLNPSEIECRVIYNKDTGLNIVPADYCAKIMYHTCIYNLPGDSFHLVNSAETPHDLYLNLMLDEIKVKGVRCVSEIPTDCNKVEQFYYKTVGLFFTPYLVSPKMDFDVTSLNELLSLKEYQCPIVDEVSFKLLMKYACNVNFGLK